MNFGRASRNPAARYARYVRQDRRAGFEFWEHVRVTYVET